MKYSQTLSWHDIACCSRVLKSFGRTDGWRVVAVTMFTARWYRVTDESESFSL